MARSRLPQYAPIVVFIPVVKELRPTLLAVSLLRRCPMPPRSIVLLQRSSFSSDAAFVVIDISARS
jgi:hypothetical protein